MKHVAMVLGVLLVLTAVSPAAAEELMTNQGTKVSDRAWDRLRGTIASVSGSTLVLKADDGRVVKVDMTAVNPMARDVLAPGERVTVIGSVGESRATAQYIRHDDAVPASPKTR
jgi:hypothetical protein